MKRKSIDNAETLVGHALGGICPFAVNKGVTVCLDCSLKRFETVFPACGCSNSAIELTIAELENKLAINRHLNIELLDKTKGI